MKRAIRFSTAVVLACALCLAAGPGAAAQRGQAQPGALARVEGSFADVSGTLIPNVTITFKDATSGQTYDAVTNDRGQFLREKIIPGNYNVTCTLNGKDVYDTVVIFAPGQDLKLDINFKVLQAEEAAQQADAAKKAADTRAKFAAMKQHFDAGNTALEQARQVRMQMDKLPAAQQAPMKGQLDQAAGSAVTELNAALDGTAETDPNRGLVLAKLGDAYELDGKDADAASAYGKAVVIKPDPASYNNLGNSLARTGKVDDALAAYQKAIELDPTRAGMYWTNFAVGLYNTGRIKESVDPLRKATEADPKNAQAWYLLGAALVNTMDFKQEGDQMVAVMQPGTVEAYQKAIDLDPNGPYGAQAKDGLAQLQALGVGVSTKVNQKPAANSNTKTPAKK